MSSLKSYLIDSYGRNLQRLTSRLQDVAKQTATSKNQWIFLEKCVTHDLIPKSFRIHCPLHSIQSGRLTRMYRKRLVKLAKSEAKGRYYKHCSRMEILFSEMKRTVSALDFNMLRNVIEKSRENQFIKTKTNLKEKFDLLLQERNRLQSFSKKRNETKVVKDAVLNLTEHEIPIHHQELLNLGPKFVPTPNHIPYMDIIKNAEIAARSLEKSKKHEEAEHLRSEVSNSLKRSLDSKPKSNLTRNQQKALKELSSSKNSTKVYPFDKGAGFAVIEEKDAIKKIEEQIGECDILDEDPTNSFAEKIRVFLRNLRKEGKLDNRTFYELYPSDPIIPRMYGMLKAHKPTKNYPMRIVVSTIGTPSYGTSKYLVDLIQPILNKHPSRINNSSSFVREAKTWNIDPLETQVSYDVVALYPSIPIEKAIEVMTDIIVSDINEIRKRTKLSIHDIRKMMELSLSLCYFLWRDKIYNIKNAGPIGLSLMVVMAEGFLQRLEEKAINQALQQKIAPITFKRYVDDSHARFLIAEHANLFLNILNSQDPNIQYTIEHEDVNKILPFLDILMQNNMMGSYDFNVYRKEAITNVQIKPESCIDPKITAGVFKGFLSRAWKICSSKHRDSKIQFLVKVFIENGYNEQTLIKLAKDYIPPELRPVITEQDNTVDINNTIVRLPWIPKITPALRKIFRKKGFKVVCSSSPNLQRLVCKNKDRLTPNSDPGVYKLDCTCGKSYVGETKKKILTRCLEHQTDACAGRWEKTGVTEHSRDCHGQFNWLNPTTLQREPKYHHRKIAESLEIQCMKTGPTEVDGVNRDSGLRLSSQSWRGFFYEWRKKEPNLLRWKSHWNRGHDYDERTSSTTNHNQSNDLNTDVLTVDTNQHHSINRH